MPVRIYDISKKLGLENKEVLSKAKELGIAAARVASSSLDKITAEYLEQQLVLAYPERTTQSPAPSEATPLTTETVPVHVPSTEVAPPTAPLPVEVQKVQIHEVTTSTATSVFEPPVSSPPAPAPVEHTDPEPTTAAAPIAAPVAHINAPPLTPQRP